MPSRARKSRFSVVSGVCFGIVVGIALPFVITFVVPVVLRLSATRSVHEFSWTAVDIMRDAEQGLCSAAATLYEPGYGVQRLAMSPVGLWIALVLTLCFDLLYSARKRSR